MFRSIFFSRLSRYGRAAVLRSKQPSRPWGRPAPAGSCGRHVYDHNGQIGRAHTGGVGQHRADRVDHGVGQNAGLDQRDLVAGMDAAGLLLGQLRCNLLGNLVLRLFDGLDQRAFQAQTIVAGLMTRPLASAFFAIMLA